MRDESEQAVIHRLESFSDIVIGFSLAQLGLTMTMPHHVADLFAHTHGLSMLGTFAVTFFLVCALWGMHHRVFRHLFVPTRINIAVNFAALGGVLFQVYAMQVVLHVSGQDRLALPLYVGTYGYISTLFAFLAWSGLRARGDRMDDDLRAISRDLAIRLSYAAVLCIVLAVASIFVGPNKTFAMTTAMLISAGAIAQRFFARRSPVRATGMGSSSPSA